MTRKPKKVPDRVDPNKIKVRDPAQLAIIQGQVKAGVHKDKKKDKDKYKARKRIKEEVEEEVE